MIGNIASAALLALLLLSACADPEKNPGPVHIGEHGIEPTQQFAQAPEDCEKLVPNMDTFADPNGLVSGWPERTAELAFVVDASFVDHWGNQWQAIAQEIVDMMDGFYRREIGLAIVAVQLSPIRFDARDYEPWDTPDGGLGQGAVVMADFIAAYEQQFGHVQRDAALLLIGTDVSGDVAGQANCIGGAGFPDVAYLWLEADDQDDGSGNETLRALKAMAAKTAIHEFGHMLGAHHHYASCAESWLSYSLDDFAAFCTVMIPDRGLAALSMSSANRLATRSWIDQVDL